MKKYKMKTELWCSQPHIAAHLQAHAQTKGLQKSCNLQRAFKD